MHPPTSSPVLVRARPLRLVRCYRLFAANRFFGLAAIVALVAGAGLPLRAANLLQNGGFENVVFTTAAAQSNGFGYVGPVPAGTPHADEAATLPGWTFAPNPASPAPQLAGAYRRDGWYGRDHLQPREGSVAMAFGVHSGNRGGTLRQTFVAQPGATYQCMLSMARIGGWDPIAAAVEIHEPSKGGIVHRQVINMSTFTPYQWRQVPINFTLPALIGGTLEIRIVDETPDNSAYGTDFVIDDVFLGQASSTVKNLLQNGGFEEHVFTTAAGQASSFGYLGSSVPVGTPHGDERATLPGWDVAGLTFNGYPTLKGVYGPGSWYGTGHLAPKTGIGAVAFGVWSSHAGGSLRQDFQGQAGAEYRGSFAIARIGGHDPIKAWVHVHRRTVSGRHENPLATLHLDLSTFPPYEWRNVEFSFAVPHDLEGASLQFAFTDATDNFTAAATDMVLDDVAIWETASPAQVLANAGPDQSVPCLTDTVAVTLDGTGSSGPGSFPLSYRWELVDAAGTKVVGTTARVGVSLPPGAATFRLVVTSATGATSEDWVTITAQPIPTITGMTPAHAQMGTGPLSVTLQGWHLLPGSTILWDGVPRTPTAAAGGALTFQATAEDLAVRKDPKSGITEDIRHARVVVWNGSAESRPMVFTIFQPAIAGSSVDSKLAMPNEFASVSTPLSSGSTVTAEVKNSSGEPLVVSAATYAMPPVGGLKVDGASAVFDLRVSGADAGDSMKVDFYYPATLQGMDEANARVAFAVATTPHPKTGEPMTTWDFVVSHTVIRNPQDNIDGKPCGGKITVKFDNTTYPRLVDFTGTAFSFGLSAPTVGLTTPAPVAPIANARMVTMTYDAVGFPADHQLALNWGDGTTVALAANIDRAVSATRTFAAPGIYTVTGTITDTTGAVGTSTLRHLVAYDPNGGFLTGGGWFNSAAGAFVAQPGASGKAHFELNSKYHKDATAPTGQVKFSFDAGRLTFASTEQAWLVVRDGKAAVKARGQINGAGDYDCFILIEDGGHGAGRAGDRIRVRIAERGGEAKLVYDNRPSAPLDLSSETQPIGGGNLTVHKAK